MESRTRMHERFLEAKAYKDRWLALYKDLYFYVIPDRDAFNIKFNYTDTGKPVTNQIWDNTAMLAAYQRANDLHGLLLPKDRVWGRLVLDPHKFNKRVIDKSQTLMDEINERIFFYINESNISRVVSSSNLDLVGGTGAIWVESISDRVPLNFRSIPAVALYIEYSTDDLINTCWFGSKKTGKAILTDFPQYEGKLKQRLIDNPNDTYLVSYGQLKLDEEYFYIYAFLDDDPLFPLWERYSTYQQIIVYRDKVRPGEAEGRGVGLDLLPTIKDLNRIVEYSRKNMSFKANPPMFYDAGTYFNPYSIRQWAGAMIARAPGGRNPLEALQMPEYHDVLEHIVHLQQVVQKGFQVDPLGEITDPVKSATEVSIRENRAQRTSATDISRLINELPKQIYSVSAKILNERNLLLSDRREIPNFAPSALKFDYVSPLYDLQNREEISHFAQNLQLKQQYFGEGAALASVNLVEANKFLTKKFNLPEKLFATEEDLHKFMIGLAQKASEAQLPPSSSAASQVGLPQPPGITV